MKTLKENLAEVTDNVIVKMTDENQKQTEKELEFQKILDTNARRTAEYVASQCLKAARNGFGSILGKFDKTWSMTQLNEGRSSTYEINDVYNILVNEYGLIIETCIEDHYDAETTKIIWNENGKEAYEKYNAKMTIPDDYDNDI